MRRLLRVSAATMLMVAAAAIASSEELIPPDGSCWNTYQRQQRPSAYGR